MDKKEITQISCSYSIELFYFIVIMKLYPMSFFLLLKLKEEILYFLLSWSQKSSMFKTFFVKIL